MAPDSDSRVARGWVPGTSQRSPRRAVRYMDALTKGVDRALGRTPRNVPEELGRTAVRADCRIADETRVRSKATLDEISLRLAEEFPAVPRVDVERDVIA